MSVGIDTAFATGTVDEINLHYTHNKEYTIVPIV